MILEIEVQQMSKKNYVVTWTYTEDGYLPATEETTDLKKACEQAKKLSEGDPTIQYMVMEVTPDLEDKDGVIYDPLYIYNDGAKFVSAEFGAKLIAAKYWDEESNFSSWDKDEDLDGMPEMHDLQRTDPEKANELTQEYTTTKFFDLPKHVQEYLASQFDYL